MEYRFGTPSFGKAPLVRKIGLTSWSVETTPHLGTVLLARRIGLKNTVTIRDGIIQCRKIGLKAWMGVLPPHPSRRFSMKERCFRYMPLLCIVVCAVVFLAVFAVMGRAVGIPYFVGGGIFGWYVRKWMRAERK